jgi:hypothetical protein
MTKSNRLQMGVEQILQVPYIKYRVIKFRDSFLICAGPSGNSVTREVRRGKKIEFTWKVWTNSIQYSLKSDNLTPSVS